MSTTTLRDLLPHASASCLKLNAALFTPVTSQPAPSTLPDGKKPAKPARKPRNRGSSATAKLERPSGDAPMDKAKGEAGDSGKFVVRVTSVRPRLLDEDNLAEKYHIDALRYAGLIPSDAPAQTHIITTQRKCRKGETPHTEILITPAQ